jgi:hypothetical protein
MELRSLNTALCTAAVFVSVLPGFAQDRKNDRDRPQQRQSSYAYYDSKHRDWHPWNEQEQQSYQRYAKEHHSANSNFASDSEREQQEYWNWRHKHPDSR